MILIGWMEEDGQRRRAERLELDADGRLVRETLYAADGSTRQDRLIRYGADGRKSETVVQNGHGDLLGTWLARYDDQGRLAAETYRNASGAIEVEDTYTYAADGSVVKTRGNVAQWTQTYDAAGRLRTSRGGYHSADVADDITIEYHPDGRPARKTEAGAPARITTYLPT